MLPPLYLIQMNASNTLPDPGGVATYTHELAYHLGRERHTVELLTYPFRGPALPLPGRPYRVRRLDSFDLRRLVERGGSPLDLLTRLPAKVLAMARDTTRIVRGRPGGTPQAVLWALTWWPEALAAFLVARRCGLPYVISAHGYEALVSREARRHRLYAAVLNRAARVFAVSGHTARLLVRCGVRADTIRVIHNGVRPERFRLTDDGKRRVDRLRARLAPSPAYLLLTLARLVPRKGHLAVVEAVADLADRVPGIRYVIAGDGPMRAEIERRARILRVEDRVVFAGNVSEEEKIDLLHACDLFVMPNRDVPLPGGVPDTEGFGIVFLEAACCGKQVVGGREGGASEAVVHEQTGLLVDTAEPSALREAILDLWQEPERARRMGTAARERAEQTFTWDRAAGQYARELREVVSAQPSPGPRRTR